MTPEAPSKPSFVLRMTLIAAMAALICVCSWLTVPSVVPFTLQTFAVFCALLLLGGKDGLYAVILYLLMGALGVPVFAGFSGGVGYMLGPTGGYLIGFVLTALLYWLCEPLFKNRRPLRYPALAVGLMLCYLAGTVWFVTVMNAPDRGGDYTFWAALLVCVVPYLIPDALKLVFAGVLCHAVSKRLKFVR